MYTHLPPAVAMGSLSDPAKRIPNIFYDDGAEGDPGGMIILGVFSAITPIKPILVIIMSALTHPNKERSGQTRTKGVVLLEKDRGGPTRPSTRGMSRPLVRVEADD